MWLLVANPLAQSGLAAGRVDAAAAALAAHGLRCEVMFTLAAGATIPAVGAHLRDGAYVGVIAFGGDGTFHEVASALLMSGRAIPMGLLPGGTGNNQARSLGLPLNDLDAAAARIAAGGCVAMDGARVQAWDDLGQALPPVWMFDSVGFGFSARTLRYRFDDKAQVEQVPYLKALYRGEWVYAGAAARALFNAAVEDHSFDAWVGTEHGRVLYENLRDLIVNNTRIYAAVWEFDPTSRHDDGEMELLAIRGLDEWMATAIVNLDGNPLRAMIDAALPPQVLRARWFEIELVDRAMEPEIPSQVDGEPWLCVNRVRIDVVQGALSVLASVPPDPSG